MTHLFQNDCLSIFENTNLCLVFVQTIKDSYWSSDTWREFPSRLTDRIHRFIQQILCLLLKLLLHTLHDSKSLDLKPVFLCLFCGLRGLNPHASFFYSTNISTRFLKVQGVAMETKSKASVTVTVVLLRVLKLYIPDDGLHLLRRTQTKPKELKKIQKKEQ